MKQFFLFLTLFSFISSKAQITIINSDIQALGVVAYQTADEAPDASILPGADGELVWDFSALANNGALEYTFVEPGTTPYDDQYPSSNLAVEQANNYFYFLKNDQALQALGTYGDFNYQTFTVTASVKIDPPQTLLQFPATLGDSYTETIVQSAQAPGSAIGLPYDSVRVERSVERSVAIDAYGMLTSPLGTFETIRSSENELTSDELWGLSFGTWQLINAVPTVESTVFNWWTKDGNFGFPVVQLQTDDAGTVTGANWVTDFISGSEETFDLQFGLYPNPAAAEVFVEFPERFEGSLEVVSLSGQTVFQKEVSTPRERVSTQNFPPGSYAIVVREQDGSLAAAKRFLVAR